MKRRVFAITSFFLLSLMPFIPASAAIKAGSSCAKLNVTTTVSGYKFTCIKSGKKLLWSKGVKIASSANSESPASATPAQTPTISPASDFSASADCKLNKPSNRAMDDGPMGSVGFPKAPNALPSLGNLKGLILFVDFPDVIATSDLKSPWQTSSIPNAEKLFAYSSYGKLKLKVDMTSKVYRLQKQSTYYNLSAAPSGGPLPGAPDPKLDEVVSDSLAAADADIDYSQYAFVTVATPQSPTLGLSGATGMGPNPKTFDGVTYTKGDFMPLDSLTPLDKTFRTLNFTHDIGHMLGLIHPYITGEGQPITGAWDIMWNFAFQNDFYGWNKWKLDWINDEQVSCLNKDVNSGVIQFLSPVGNPSNAKKLVIIKLNATSALAIEVRRKSPFEDLKPSDEGVIVYRVDTTKAQGEGPFTLVSNLKKMITYQNFPGILGTMKPGESITTNGYVISVLQTVTDGDYISIKKSA